MITIKEFLADPAGPDTGAEYISLVNKTEATASLTGWTLQDKSGKTFSLSGYTLPAGKELRFFSSVTKITLNNSDETVSLFDASGALIDELILSGKAISGQPTVRLDTLTAEVRAKLFDELAGDSLPEAHATTTQVFGFWLIISLTLALAAMLAIRTIKDNDQEDENNEPGWPA